ncbi:hypothetical protein U0070_011435, partial [Myodes glareolus]
SACLHVRVSSPYTLQRLARKSLLKNEALANASLKKLPKTIFPPMFKDTFIGKQTNIVRAMVTAWPFPCLPVGSLMKTPNLKTLKAVLGGLDLLINQKDRHRHWVEGSDHRLQNVVQVESDLREVNKCKRTVRKDVVQVMCPKLEFGATPLYNPLMLLEVFEPSSIEEFAVNARWTLRTLVMIAPGLGQMKNFRKSFSMESSHLWSVLETERGENEMSYLSQCPSIHKLKHLDLSSVNFLNLDHLLLGSLLERLTATLQTLQLKGCIIMDFQISALLPALSQCTQLIEVNFLKNFLSVDSLKKLLLQHTAKLTLLTREIYPTPDEVYDDIGDVQPDRFSQHCCELMETLRTLRQSKEVH